MGVAVEEAEIERLAAGGVVAGVFFTGQCEVKAATGPIFAAEEEGDAVEAEGVEETVAQGLEHGVAVGFRAELAGEGDESLAIVVTVFIKDVAVHLFLEPVADGLKDEGGEEDEGDDGGGREIAGLGEREDEAVENAEDGEGGDGVDIALLEDDVDVHEAVTEDSVGPGDGDEGEGKDGHFLVVARDGAHEKGDDVDDGEGEDADDGAVAEVLDLAANDGVVGLVQLEGEDGGAGEIAGAEVEQPDAVEQPADLDQRGGDSKHALGDEEVEQEQGDGGEVDDGDAEARRGSTGAVREGEAEVEKESGGEDAGDEIAEINNLVEDVELAGVVEAGEDEGGQAEEEEVGGVGGVGTAKINEESDEEIDGADGVLIIDGGIGDIFADDDVGAEGDAVAADGVEGGGPASDGLEEAGDLRRLCGRRNRRSG